jgi:hypothetical protein
VKEFERSSVLIRREELSLNFLNCLAVNVGWITALKLTHFATVLFHSTGDWSLATARRGCWMNEKRMKTSVNRGEVSLSPAHEAGSAAPPAPFSMRIVFHRI